MCTGNICRSPIAEGLLRQRLEARGIPAHVHSAGFVTHGDPASAYGIVVLHDDYRVDLRGHRSRRLKTKRRAKKAATPPSTSIQFQAAASNNPAGVFSYVGPDGTAGSFFSSGDSLSQFNGFRYVRYRAYLSTSDSTVTPALNDVSVCFNDVSSPTTLTVSPA